MLLGQAGQRKAVRGEAKKGKARQTMKIKAPAGELVPGAHAWTRFQYDICEALNWSRIKLWEGNCPAKAKWLEENGDSGAAHFVFGERVHCAALEPERFAKEYVIRPARWEHGGGHLKATPRSAEPTSKEDAALNRELKEAWDKSAKGKEIIDAADGALIEAMVERLEEHPIVGPILKHTVAVRNELTCVAQLDDGMWAKCLIDIELSVDATEAHSLFDPEGKLPSGYFPGGVWLGDLKTTSGGAGPGHTVGTWGYAVAKYRYLGQAAWYLDTYEKATGIRPAGFIFIPVEKEPPYETAAYYCTDEQIKSGRKLYKRLLAQRQLAFASGKFPSYSPYMHPMSCAGWGMER